MIAERLYQAIIDKVTDEGLEWPEAAVACGFEPNDLLECFRGMPHSRDLNIYDYLGREQINKTAEFLGCPSVRIFFMADVFRPGDMRTLSAAATGDPHVTSEVGLEVIGQFMLDLTQSKFYGEPEPVISEFIGATLSANLAEACKKTCLPIKKVEAWRKGEPASLADLEYLRRMAEAIGITQSPVLLAMGVLKLEDFYWKGQLVNPMVELQHALNINLW